MTRAAGLGAFSSLSHLLLYEVSEVDRGEGLILAMANVPFENQIINIKY